ncbi:MAG: stage III sporulation protein AA [bacterium]|nr:stage III sporulation protein AA [bacterium]
MEEREREIWRFFPARLRQRLGNLEAQMTQLQEIRLRVGRPISVRICGREVVLEEESVVSREDIRDFVESVSRHSLYAHEEEIRQGFFTIAGGHRIGIAGKAVTENGTLRTIKYISSVNIRLAHQIRGCAKTLVPQLFEEGELCNTLILSPPCGGKTTLLRDCIRILSEGGLNLGVVDERSEIAACYQGVMQNDLGPRTDVLDCCPKAVGMMMLIRTMAPQVVAVDEIGGEDDRKALESVMKCGCRILATAHAASVSDMKQKPFFRFFVENQMFGRYLVLKSGGQAGRVEGIYDASGRRLAG